MTFLGCEVWLARDFLARHGRDPGPPCGHDPSDCPPITGQPAHNCRVCRSEQLGGPDA